jgi:ABC-2 type transport system ATP-binding protein
MFGQRVQLWWDLPLLDSFDLLRHIYKVPAERYRENLAAFRDLLDLDPFLRTPVRQLSLGQRIRGELVASLLHDPEVVFLDEPTASLDPQARRNLWDLLSGLNDSGRTVVLTTHYMDEAEILCDRVAIMDHGKILRLDTPAALIRGLDAPTRITVNSGQLTVDDARGIAGVDGAEERPDGLVLVTRSPATVVARLAELEQLDGVRVHTGTLEDVFLDLTGREYRA